MTTSDFMDELEDLVSAEDFFEYFEIPYDETVVKVYRLHILQRFHNYLTAAKMPTDEAGMRAIYVNALAQAHQDFLNSDAATEQVLKVYQRANGTSFFDAGSIGKGL
jgi:nitrogenase-stabilizing/protective protein